MYIIYDLVLKIEISRFLLESLCLYMWYWSSLITRFVHIKSSGSVNCHKYFWEALDEMADILQTLLTVFHKRNCLYFDSNFLR